MSYNKAISMPYSYLYISISYNLSRWKFLGKEKIFTYLRGKNISSFGIPVMIEEVGDSGFRF